MCSCAHLVYLSHLLGLAAGVMFIRELVRLKMGNRVLYIGAGCAAVVMAGFLFHVSNPVNYFSDFMKAYWPAARAIVQGPEALAELFRLGAFGFVNLPVVAFVLAPLGLLAPTPAAIAFTLLGLVSIVLAWRLLARAAHLDSAGMALLAFLFAAFGPLLYSIREGNTTHMVLALLAYAFLLLRERRDLLAGVILGIAALIKLPLLLFAIYYVLRGRWSVVAGGAAFIGVVSLLSLAIFGWDMHVLWYQSCVAPYMRDPIPALNVQSVAAALARLQLGPASVLDWTQHTLSPTLRVLASASTALLLILAAASALMPRREGVRTVKQGTAEELEFLIVLMLACIVSPLSWSHYYTWMLMPIAFFVGRTAHFSRLPAARVAGWVAIVLAAAPVTFWQPSMPLVAELHGRLAVSHLLYGGLVMLGLLIWSRWQMRAPGDRVLAGTPAAAPA